MNRSEAFDAIRENVRTENLIKHMLATEATMRALARRFGEDEEVWGLTGLLHDIDVELTRGDAGAHSKLGAEMVRQLGCSEESLPRRPLPQSGAPDPIREPSG